MGEGGDFSLLDFEACFKQHKDTDDGLVTKAEMISFIKKVVGLTDEDDWEESPSLSIHELKHAYRVGMVLSMYI